jgi:hypothetical protein
VAIFLKRFLAETFPFSSSFELSPVEADSQYRRAKAMAVMPAATEENKANNEVK